MKGMPDLIIFDVNETLSDMAPMAERFADVGAPEHLAKTWFAGLLRDGFALTAVDASDSFARLAAESLQGCLHGVALNRDSEAAIDHIMEGFAALPVHADVPDGIRALGALEIRLVTLSNGSVSVAEALFDRAGLLGELEHLLSVEEAGRWKPAPEAYGYALRECGVDAEQAQVRGGTPLPVVLVEQLPGVLVLAHDVDRAQPRRAVGEQDARTEGAHEERLVRDAHPAERPGHTPHLGRYAPRYPPRPQGFCCA